MILDFKTWAMHYSGIWEANPLFPGVWTEFIKGTEGSQGRLLMHAAGMNGRTGLLPGMLQCTPMRAGTPRAKNLLSFKVFPLRFCITTET